MGDRTIQGFFGVFGTTDRSESIEEAVDVFGSTDAVRSTHWHGSCGVVMGSPPKEIVDNCNDQWRGWLSGDLPGSRDVPWERIVNAISSRDYSFLNNLNGQFAILLVQEATGRVWAISDRRAQQPLFSYSAGDFFYVSTNAAACSRVQRPPPFDVRWLYETIYFNHPMLDRSFLEGVARVPPATIVSWRPGDRHFGFQPWAMPFSRPEKLLRGEDAARLEQTTFREVARDLFYDDSSIAVALTAGFDSRAALAAAPRQSDLLAYTYGGAGCTDLRDAAAVAADLGIDHLAIELSDEFVRSIPDLMVATVRDSDGLERVLRAELLAVYPLLADMGRDISIGGVSGDHVFRDHLNGTGNVPHIISAPMMAYLQRRGDGLPNHDFSALLGRAYDEFHAHISACLNHLNERHGDMRCPEGYQRYLLYESAPKHFGGEAAIASNYMLFRSFYWDPRIVELSFTTDRATMGLSERLSKKDYFLEAAAQAGVIATGKYYGGGRIHGVRAATWARSSRSLYVIEKLLTRGPSYIANGFKPPVSADFLSWRDWLAGPAKPLCRELLGPDARLRQYLDGKFLDTFEPISDLRLASRLLTAELVIRLLEERWPSSFHVDGVSCDARS